MRLIEFLATAVGSAGIIWHRMPDRRDVADAEIITEAPYVSGWMHSACDDDGHVIWPDDLDEVPAWRLEREAWAAAAGIKLPAYRTRREMEQLLDLAEIETAPMVAPPQPVAISVDACAVQFAAYLREHGGGEYSAAEINESYADFCTSQNIVPPPVDSVKAALPFQPGIHRGKIDVKVDGRRQRLVRWLIEAPSDADVTDSDLRLAA